MTTHLETGEGLTLTAEMLDRLERLEREATCAPWCHENIGEKYNCIAIGQAWPTNDKGDLGEPVAGHLHEGPDEEYYRESVCFIEDDEHSACGSLHADAALIAELRNHAKELIALARKAVVE